MPYGHGAVVDLALVPAAAEKGRDKEACFRILIPMSLDDA